MNDNNIYITITKNNNNGPNGKSQGRFRPRGQKIPNTVTYNGERLKIQKAGSSNGTNYGLAVTKYGAAHITPTGRLVFDSVVKSSPIRIIKNFPVLQSSGIKVTSRDSNTKRNWKYIPGKTGNGKPWEDQVEKMILKDFPKDSFVRLTDDESEAVGADFAGKNYDVDAKTVNQFTSNEVKRIKTDAELGRPYWVYLKNRGRFVVTPNMLVSTGQMKLGVRLIIS